MAEEQVEFQIPKRGLAIEFWVGIFAALGIAAFAYLAINIAGMRFSNTGQYEVLAEFDSVAGLKVGAPVEIAGVEVGEVVRIGLGKEHETAATVSMQIKDSVKLRDDDIAAIRTKGIIGDRYVKIVPGGSKDLIKPGGNLSETESAVEFEEIIGKFIHKFES